VKCHENTYINRNNMKEQEITKLVRFALLPTVSVVLIVSECCEVGIQNSPPYRACEGTGSQWECMRYSTTTSVTFVNVYGNGDCENCIWTQGDDPITLPIHQCWNDDTECGANG
jgi:hypothetical protein